MELFSKKEKIFLGSEQQKDDMIEKLENAHVKYDIRVDRENVNTGRTSYILRLKAADLKLIS